MYDIRPVGYVTGLLVLVLGLTMLVPMAVDIYYDNGHWPAFFESAIITALTPRWVWLEWVSKPVTRVLSATMPL